MRSFWAQSLRRQVVIAIWLLLIPVLAIAVWSGVATLRERTEDLREQTHLITATTAAYVSRDLANLDLLANGVSQLPFVQALDAEQSQTLFNRLPPGRPSLLSVVLINRDGRELARVDTSADVISGDTAWAASVFRTGQRTLSRLQGGSTNQLPYVVIGYPVRGPGGRVDGALGLFVDLQTLEDTFATLPLPPGSVVSITDAEGRIVARSADAERYLGRVARDPGLSIAEVPETEERVGVDGVSRMYGHEPIADGRWLVSVAIPTSVAVNNAVALWARSSTILILGLAGWIGVAFLLAQRLTRSVSYLEATAQRIAAGDFSPIEPRPMPTREFGKLQDAFVKMLGRFNDTRHALDQQMAEERGIREELQSLQRQVIRQERLAAVGQLVSGVAHEINNPLQAILGFAELLQMQSDLPEAARHDLTLIQKESTRACGIIRNLAMFARQQPGEAKPVPLADVIASVAELRQRRLESEDIELRVEVSSTQRVLAVFTELQQVVLNFVVNAEQSILQSGRLPGRISIRCRDEGPRVLLEVEDTGPGVPPENEAKLFQPFFTTKPVGQGTGLGLSVSYGIIDSMGGRLGYRRAPAGGAIFYFELPAAPREDA